MAVFSFDPVNKFLKKPNNKEYRNRPGNKIIASEIYQKDLTHNLFKIIENMDKWCGVIKYGTASGQKNSRILP